MGYSGLDVFGSDTASDAAYVAFIPTVKKLKRELHAKGNTYNTSGVENVSMIFYEMVTDKLAWFDEWATLAEETRERLQTLIEKTRAVKYEGATSAIRKHRRMSDAANKRYHLAAYRKWLRRLDRFIAAKL